MRIQLQTAVGAILAVASGFALERQLHVVPLNEKLIWLFVGIGSMGLYLMFPIAVQGFVKTIVIVTPWANWGRRKEDVDISAAPPGTKPGDPIKPAPPVEAGDA